MNYPEVTVIPPGNPGIHLKMQYGYNTGQVVSHYLTVEQARLLVVRLTDALTKVTSWV